LQAWVHTSYCNIFEVNTNQISVDLGGSLAVASRGLYATGVSTDLNGKLMLILTHLASPGNQV